MNEVVAVLADVARDRRGGLTSYLNPKSVLKDEVVGCHPLDIVVIGEQ